MDATVILYHAGLGLAWLFQANPTLRAREGGKFPASLERADRSRAETVDQGSYGIGIESLFESIFASVLVALAVGAEDDIRTAQPIGTIGTLIVGKVSPTVFGGIVAIGHSGIIVAGDVDIDVRQRLQLLDSR